MHDIRLIRQNATGFDAALVRRGYPPVATTLIAIDERRRHEIQQLEQAQARRNEISKQIGQAKAKKDSASAEALMSEVSRLKDLIPRLEVEVKTQEERLTSELSAVPNLPLDEVPYGNDEKDNVEHHRFGAKCDYAFSPKQHFDLGETLGQMDFETAAKLSGARFVVLQKGLARVERALGQFFLDVHTAEHGYTEVAPPLLVRDDAMFGTAQLPKFREDQFSVEAPLRYYEPIADGIVRKNYNPEVTGTSEWKTSTVVKAVERGLSFRPPQFFWLIPTAEVPLTNLVRESILDEAQLPLRYTACTPCFRAEAGAAGKDTRGMIRQHQFTKVELVSITTPEQSRDEHERMLACAEEVLKRLGLHYRTMMLCTGDMGFASQKTYDIEVWLPGQNMYREISSCSICGEFQARRMNARYRTKEGRNVRHVHTLNGSGVAVGRALIAVMENYQQEDGSIAVPDALAPYMGGLKKIEK
jgi:seryl-tRNA synthetase